MKLVLRYLKNSLAGSSIAICFILISYCILSPGSFFSPEKLYISHTLYYGFLGAIYVAIFLSLLIIIEKIKPKLLAAYTSCSYQVIGVLSAIITVLPAIAITITESHLPLINELKSILIFILAHTFIGWFVGMLLGKINKTHA